MFSPNRRNQWNLSELLQGIEGIPLGAWSGTAVCGIAIDSRKVQPGDLFVALPGRRASGIHFLEEAVRRGARGVVVPLDNASTRDIPGLRAVKPRDALALIAGRFYGHPSRDLFLVGVTGTNGKSTLVHMVAQILEAAGRPAGYWSTPQVYTGKHRFRPTLTTPEAHEFNGFLREVRDAGMRYGCVEVSSHGIEQKRVEGVEFDVGVVTNASKDHLDFHQSFEEYVAVKRGFIEGLGEEVTCFLNGDDPHVESMGERAGARVIRYGLSKHPLRAVNPVYSPTGTRFTVHLDLRIGPESPGEFPITLSVPGRHNVFNSLAAIGAGLGAGVPIGMIQRALAAFRPPARRFETQRIGPYTVINDVAMNEAGYEAVLQTMASLDFPQLVVAGAIRGNRGADVNAGIARVLAKWNRTLHFAPLIVSASRTHAAKYDADYRVRLEELTTFTKAAEEDGLSLSVHEELPDAISEGVDRLNPHGVLLLLGTFGMDEGPFLAEGMLRRRVEIEAPDGCKPR